MHLDGHEQPCLLTFIHDLTERTRAEQALRASEERHRVIAELTSDYAYTCRLEADGSFTLVHVTDGFTRVSGYTLAEVQDRLSKLQASLAAVILKGRV